MKVAKLSGSPRANVGKKDAKALRAAGRIPCVLYGQGKQTHFSVLDTDMEKLVITPHVYQIELDIDGQQVKAIIQDLQQDPVRDTIRHVDFFELDPKKAVKVGLPVQIVGRSPGIMNGGKLSQTFRRLKVVGLPDALPEVITVDISKLRIGDSIRVRDLSVDGVEFMDADSAVVVAVRMARGASLTSDEEDEDGEGESAEGEAKEEAAAEA
ncbi:MAG: 50S ribosomal protein L25 [Bacteroidetes bacterium]|nr:MAG: 50S ribosomal protein L25 [Bacteroidota bacterium]